MGSSSDHHPESPARGPYKSTPGWEITMTIAVEVHDKRFGVIAVEEGYITKEQLFEALKIQVEEDLLGNPHTLIGIILIRLGYLTREEADHVLLTLKKSNRLLVAEILGLIWELSVTAMLFFVPGTEDRGQLPLELLFGDLPVLECLTKLPDPNLCIGQGFKGSVSPLG